MPWPATSGTTPGYTSSLTTIRYGTDGLLQSPRLGSNQYYTVLRFNERPLVDNQKHPNGTGIDAIRVLLKHGAEFTLTVRDDSRMSPPQVGQTIAVVDAAGIIVNYGANGTPSVFTCTVINPSYEAAPKQPGERVILCENLILIESQSGTGQA